MIDRIEPMELEEYVRVPNDEYQRKQEIIESYEKAVDELQDVIIDEDKQYSKDEKIKYSKAIIKELLKHLEEI